MTFKPDIFSPEKLDKLTPEERIANIKARLDVLADHANDPDTQKTIESLERILVGIETPKQILE